MNLYTRCSSGRVRTRRTSLASQPRRRRLGGDGRSPVAVFDISKGTATRSEHRQVEIEFRRTRKVEQIAELLSHIMLLFDGASLVLEPRTRALGENRDRGELEQQLN